MKSNPDSGDFVCNKHRAYFALVAFICLTTWVCQRAAPAAEAAGPRRVAEPLVKPFFVPLPPGAVQPAGWLRDWAVAAGNGITGHLDEWHPTFGEAWKGVPISGAPGAEPDGAGWPLEQSSYWLDGLLRLGYALHDEALIQKATVRLRLVVDGVNKGAPYFTYWKKESPQGFNSWAHSQMGRALVAWYAASGDKRILDALVKVYSGYSMDKEQLRFGDVSGLCNIDAMLETFAFSGDARVLESVKKAAASPGFTTAVEDWLSGRLSEGHAVIIYEDARLPALLYPWMGEERFLEASQRVFTWMEKKNLLPYSVTSGEEYLSGIGALRKTETCDVAAQMWSMMWMYRLEGRREYGEKIEGAFFNAGAAPIARDFKTMSYYQSPNRLRSDSLPCEQPTCPGPGAIRFSSLGCSNVLCCVGAVNRIIPTYVSHMWMATRDNGLAAVLYGPCTVSTVAGPDVPVKLACQTDYPFEETIKISVEPERKAIFRLAFRIPGEFGKTRITINGTVNKTPMSFEGFVPVVREWAKGDKVELHFPMPVRVIHGQETEFPISVTNYFAFEPPGVFAKRRLPYASVLRGPLLFALPIPDQDPNTPASQARWQYALDNDPKRAGADLEVERRPMPVRWNWPLDAPLVLKVPAKVIDWNPTDAQALPNAPVEADKSEVIRLIPYGCTKFRISMFPVTPKAWGRGGD